MMKKTVSAAEMQTKSTPSFASIWPNRRRSIICPLPSTSIIYFQNASTRPSPQNIAYKAVRIAAPDQADYFLRRIREATMTEGAVTGDYAVLETLAEDFGLPMDAYREALKSGEAEKAFWSDVDEAIAAKVQVFPTVTLSVSGKEETFGGYYTFADYVARIRKLSGGTIEPVKPDVSIEHLHRMLTDYRRLAAEEIRCAFAFESKAALESWLTPYLSEGKLKKEPCGTDDYLISLTSV